MPSYYPPPDYWQIPQGKPKQRTRNGLIIVGAILVGLILVIVHIGAVGSSHREILLRKGELLLDEGVAHGQGVDGSSHIGNSIFLSRTATSHDLP